MLKTKYFFACASAVLLTSLVFTACGDDGSSAVRDSSSSVSGSDRESGSNGKSGVKDESEYDAVANTLTDKRNGQVYRTVKIGDQTWMAENLNYAYNEPTAQEDSSSFCYNNIAESCAKYGRLYLWSAAMDSAAVFSDDSKGCGYNHNRTCSASEPVRGVCPEGWHLPSYDEWNTLVTAVGDSSTAGTMLKSQTGWAAEKGTPAGSDAYGFSALPAGYRSDADNNPGIYHFDIVGNSAYFWSSSVRYGSGYFMTLEFNCEKAEMFGTGQAYAVSVRCLKDN